MPQCFRQTVYCYCSPPRQALVVRYTAAERAVMVRDAFAEVLAPLAYPFVAFARWLTAPGDTIQMREVDPVCIHGFQLDEMTPTRNERLMSPEAVRAHHQRLAFEAERSESGRRAFEAHRRAHREAALAIRAERQK